MADIDIKQPAKINRNTAADGDFLWEKDFKVLYENDEKLKNAIQQASQDYTAGDGIDIDPTTKTISVKTGTGIEKTDEGLSVNIEGEGGVDVQLNGNTFKVSAYNAEPVIEGLNDNLEELQNELDAFEEEVAEKYITSGNEMVPNHQYVYTTSGWADIGGEHATVSYWRPTYNESTGKLSWQMSPSIEAPDDALVKGDKGDNGKTPQFRVDLDTNFWEWKYTDEPESDWHSTNTSATGPQGANGEQGDRGYTPEITHAVDTANSGIKVTISWPAGSQIPEDNFIIPSGAPGTPGINGTNGTNGTDGITPKLRVDSSTNRWQVSYDNGTNWADISPATSATGPKGPKGDAPTIQATTLAPTTEHTEGGVRWTIKYPEMSVSAIGDIWNGNNGTATVNCEGTYITGNGTAGNVIRPTTETIDILQSVSGKVNKPDTSLTDKYLALRTNLDGTVSGWTDILDKVYSRTAADNRYMQNHRDYTLSGNGTTNSPLGIDTKDLDDNKKYAFTTNGWDEIDDFVKKTGDTMTGPLVVSASNHNIVGLGKGTFQFGQTRYNDDNNVIGTNWMGVGSNGCGFLKYAAGGPSASEEGTNGKVQINYSVDNGRGKIEVNASVPNGLNSSTQVINATTASVNEMAVSAIDSNNMSGPNYMIAKNADGQFVIGAAVYNCQGNLPGTLTPNTYYFVY